MSYLEPYEDDPAAALAEALDELRRLSADAVASLAAEDTANTAIVPTTSNLPATQVKAQMARRRSDIVKKRAAIERLSREIEQRVQAQMSELLAVMSPMKEMVRRLEEGIWTVNLYLGRDEEIITLADGEPAGADTPITVRQLVLSMDQESMVAADVGGIDASGIEAFDNWILAEADHLEQVLPEQKGVVVLVPRMARDRDYGDPWLQQHMDAANHQSYWLIRNGSQLYRMSTSFDVGARLVPARDEFTSFFRRGGNGRDGAGTVEPGSREWMQAEKSADARKRHFMRVALVLQGLIDRTPVFHPLPDAGVNLLDPDTYDDGRAVMVTDAEAALGTGREPFYTWLRRHNESLRPGMRVVCAFNSEEWRAASRASRDWDPKRITPKGAEGLIDGKLYRIDGRQRRDGEDRLILRFERSDLRWEEYTEPSDKPGWVFRRHRQVPYQKRASVYLLASDRFVLPFDAVSVAEMEAYLSDRTERHAYVTMVPLLKAAIAAKAAEAKEEAPFRLLVTGIIHQQTGDPVPDIEAQLEELVTWWKLANRWHRPLVGDGDDQTKAIAAITEEYMRRQDAAATGERDAKREAAMVRRLRDQHPEATLIARKRDGSYVVLEPSDQRLIHAERHLYSTTGKHRETKSWVLVGGAHQRWRTLFSDRRWETWNHGASPATALTGPELDLVCDQLMAAMPAGWVPVGVRLYMSEGRYQAEGFQPVDLDATWPQQPLTGRSLYGIPQGVVKGRWKRRSGNELTVQPRRLVESLWHWDDDPFDEDNQWWQTQRVDEAALAQLNALLTEGRARTRVVRRLQAQLRDAVDSVAAQHDAQMLAAAYDRFLDDYADDSLWEGHRKTLKLPPFDPQQRRLVESVLAALIERGALLGGITLAEAAQAAEALTGSRVELDARTAAFTVRPPDSDDELDGEDRPDQRQGGG